MKYIKTLEETIKLYSDEELDELFHKLSDIVYVSYNIVDEKVCDNPIHRMLNKYWDLVSRERVDRAIHKQ